MCEDEQSAKLNTEIGVRDSENSTFLDIFVFSRWPTYIKRVVNSSFGYERVCLPLCKVADTPFHIYQRGRIIARHFNSNILVPDVTNQSVIIKFPINYYFFAY